jgi:magnesium chelatase subunit I
LHSELLALAGAKQDLSAADPSLLSFYLAGSLPLDLDFKQKLLSLRSESRAPVLFPGIVGYDDTVVPQIVNAILSRHNFILLGLRGQAKSRILRALDTLLDPHMPYIAGCEIRDNPTRPSAAAAAT